MKIRSVFSILFLSLFLFASCGDSQKKLSQKIDKLENQEILKLKDKEELTEAYLRYATKYPEDSASRLYLYRATEFQFLLEKYEELVGTSDRFIEKYPNTYEANMLLYTKAKGLQGLGKTREAIQSMQEFNKLKSRLSSEEMSFYGVLFQDFVLKNPNDSLAPSYSLQLANVMSALDNKEGALQQFKKFPEQFPDHSDIPYAMMQAADISDKHFQDTAQARRILVELMEKYPEHPFGQEAKTIIEKGYIGKSNEEILKDILKNP